MSNSNTTQGNPNSMPKSDKGSGDKDQRSSAQPKQPTGGQHSGQSNPGGQGQQQGGQQPHRGGQSGGQGGGSGTGHQSGGNPDDKHRGKQEDMNRGGRG
jgi:hypothetical protein